MASTLKPEDAEVEEAVSKALSNGELEIIGRASKRALGRPSAETMLDLSGLQV